MCHALMERYFVAAIQVILSVLIWFEIATSGSNKGYVDLDEETINAET